MITWPRCTKGLGQNGPDPGLFLTWVAKQAGPAMGVEAAVLFDVHWLTFPGPPPWLDETAA